MKGIRAPLADVRVSAVDGDERLVVYKRTVGDIFQSKGTLADHCDAHLLVLIGHVSLRKGARGQQNAYCRKK